MAKPKVETKRMRLNTAIYWDKRKLEKMLSDGWEVLSQNSKFLSSKTEYVFKRQRA